MNVYYTQRQKLSTTNFVAKIFRARLCDVNKPYKKKTASFKDNHVILQKYVMVSSTKAHRGQLILIATLCT